MSPERNQHDIGHPQCTPRLHCHSHHVDEAEDRVFVSCGECGHVYRYAVSMWWAYVREHFKLFRQDMRAPLRFPALLPVLGDMYHWSLRWPRVAAVMIMVRAPFTRPSKIGFCQECIHNL